MYNPVSTIRLQFNVNFTFSDLERCIPFISWLGIRTIYASPIFRSVPGSLHGYDVTNPCEINPELGTEIQFRLLVSTLNEKGIGWIQDIVPNHMAFHQTNDWLMDVLENGAASDYATFFDTSFADPFFRGKLVVPVLDASVQDAIDDGKLKVIHDRKFYLEYSGNRFPMNKQSIAMLNEDLASVNSDSTLLHQLVELQHYRLCDWRETNKQINYRRFFTVNSLICLNMQSPEVFRKHHRLIQSFLHDGLFSGLRVDHIDGLLDPQAYLAELRQLCGPGIYINIEKILEPDEKLAISWPVQGTTGYDFLATMNNLFTHRAAEHQFDSFYKELVGAGGSIQKQIRRKKAEILFNNMAGELDNLYHYWIALGLSHDHPLLKNTIAAFLIHCPWYRFYGNSFPLDDREKKLVLEVIDDCLNDKGIESEAMLLQEVLIENPAKNDLHYNRNVLAFYQRMMQLSGPLMAKGVEDTFMYTFTRFVAHNEVGDSPEEFGTSITSFHSAMAERQAHWPLAMSSTATHDTKRGEDVRMRLNVLTDISDEWIVLVRDWLRSGLEESESIDNGEKYLIFQTIAGCFPMDGNTEGFLERLKNYFIKAFREAKRHTAWENPKEDFENAVKGYVSALMTNSSFRDSLLPFVRKVIDFGIINSLAQVILKMTCPGVPDIYQGSLLWDLSLVDPDNRQPVDYELLSSYQPELQNEPVTIESLWHTRNDGRIKLWLTKKLLQIRNEHAAVFKVGRYVPVEVSGRYKSNVVAFCRDHQDVRVLVIVSLHLARVASDADALHAIDWRDTFINLPPGFPVEWTSMLEKCDGTHNGTIRMHDIFGTLPFAVVAFKKVNHYRRAGVLLPVSALPSISPVGDLGPMARAFADFLFRSGQKVWQMLPLNVADDKVGFSPYSAYSAVAGSPLFISPEDLAAEGLLSAEHLSAKNSRLIKANDFAAAYLLKDKLLGLAWENFNSRRPVALTNAFHDFLEAEKQWLDDFATFELIYRKEKRPWTDWPEVLKQRDEKTIADLKADYHHDLQRIKWIQFIFFRQMRALRAYCNDRGILLMGDLAFYVSHNSADVWVHKELFEIDINGAVNGMAGVPPDYFNADGQLWGMPVYRWPEMQKQQYSWWTLRIKKNMEFFDLLRLDHFRAVCDFWCVPKGETTAINGLWQSGPGEEIFSRLKEELGEVPFIAEDLGDISEKVYELRNKLNFPGMKVLQFGFGNDFPASPHLPHNHSSNFVVYTGTHDNNTSRGWHENELTAAGRNNFESYTGVASGAKAAMQLIRLAYSSVAGTAIIPVQDILNLPAGARLNTPSSTKGNWTWRMKSIPESKVEEMLSALCHTFGR
jgi:malto-oligosyltrehalose synthase/4-alpha-glucanotransferase